MSDEKVSDTFKLKIEELFPNIEVNNKQEVINTFGDAIDKVFVGFVESKYIKYFEARPKNTNQAEYMSKVPDGVDHFENWLKNYFYNKP